MAIDPIALIKTLGLVGVMIIVFAETGLFFGFFLPGDSLLFSAGLLAAAGFISFWPLLVGVIVAAIIGDSVGYWFGRKVGYRIFFKEDSFFFNKKYIDKTKLFFEKYGSKTIIFARFVPIVRTFAPILAGVGGMNYKTFLRFNILGGFLWPIILVPAGYFLGNKIPNIDQYILPVAGIIILLSFLPFLTTLFKRKKT